VQVGAQLLSEGNRLTRHALLSNSLNVISFEQVAGLNRFVARKRNMASSRSSFDMLTGQKFLLRNSGEDGVIGGQDVALLQLLDCVELLGVVEYLAC
jgi:hypothetical protein